ncbi:hypothetical protein Poli38472_003520 [Pythium oligandrum]|uniref:phosphopyruvate hydratase n=1 Tax=Pythium oligandrum TaxID=41045 RepID=A0A8K1C6Z3_PYTOL|nr:hypothetical protein Poli38472_003520 [Pythium oligandrum]|eukprot:TMW57595.1 hypothetical protein Poli38472_003520 [Pythium oligandrum]
MVRQENVDIAPDDSEVRERDLVEAYLQEHALETELNQVINQVVADRPEDPFLVLSSLLYVKATAKRGIVHVEVKEVLDGLGLPGILVRLHTGKGVFEASIPSSVLGLPDIPEVVDEFAPTIPEDKQRYGGCGYKLRAEQAQVLLIEKLVDLEPTDQAAIDSILTRLEPDIGRNICLAASIAVCKAAAKYAELPLFEYIAMLLELPLENVCIPMPQFSVVNGGKYASNKLFVQEIFVAPVSATSFADALQLGTEFNRSLRVQLDERGVGFSNTGAFGGFAPQMQTLAETFQTLRAAVDDTRTRIEAAGAAALLLDPTSITPLRFEFGIDFAASEFVELSTAGGGADPDEATRTTFTYNTDKWVTGSSGGLQNSDGMLLMVRSLIRELNVTSVVDPFDGGDIKAFAGLFSSELDREEDESEAAPRRMIGGDPNCRLQIVGDTLAQEHGLDTISDERAANTILLQLHQFTTVSRALETITDARRLGLSIILGVTASQATSEGSFVAALAIGAGIGQVKFGGLSASDCVERYNQLLLASEEPNAPGFVASAYRR